MGGRINGREGVGDGRRVRTRRGWGDGPSRGKGGRGQAGVGGRCGRGGRYALPVEAEVVENGRAGIAVAFAGDGQAPINIGAKGDGLG